MPVIGANIMIKGTTNGTITDIDGNYALDVPVSAILQISYIGYLTQDVPVNGKQQINVRLGVPPGFVITFNCSKAYIP